MTEELLSNSMAAQVLSELDPSKSPEQWLGWLQNNRNQSRRVPYRIPFERISGGIFYARAELGKFAEFEKQRQLGTIKLTARAAEVLRAFGTGEGGSAYGRRWKGGDAYLQNDGKRTFVKVTIKEPLMVYAMTPEQASAFAKELSEAAEAAIRQNSQAAQNKPDLSDYKVVTDNATMLMMRKETK